MSDQTTPDGTTSEVTATNASTEAPAKKATPRKRAATKRATATASVTKDGTAKKTTAKKTAAKKSTAKSTTAKKSAAKSTTAAKTTSTRTTAKVAAETATAKQTGTAARSSSPTTTAKKAARKASAAKTTARATATPTRPTARTAPVVPAPTEDSFATQDAGTPSAAPVSGGAPATPVRKRPARSAIKKSTSPAVTPAVDAAKAKAAAPAKAQKPKKLSRARSVEKAVARRARALEQNTAEQFKDFERMASSSASTAEEAAANLVKEVRQIFPQMPDEPMSGPLAVATAAIKAYSTEWLKYWHRQQIVVDTPIPDGPCLIVGNRGFGGFQDVNIWALYRALNEVGNTRPITSVVQPGHRTTDILGKMLENGGSRPATQEEARSAFTQGHHVLIFPGGDLDAAKPFRKRNKISFHGRKDFAKLATEAVDGGVPVVPVITAGAGEGQFVLTDGRKLAQLLKFDNRFRSEAAPISLSFPFGLGMGFIGLTPSIPLPTKLVTAILPAMYCGTDERPEDFADRIQKAMQKRMNQLVKGRIPVIG